MLSPSMSQPLSRLSQLLLVLAVIASRMPLLFDGYGADPALWRAALTARELRESFVYLPTDFPGQPLHELVSAFFGPNNYAVNLVSTLACALLAVLTARLCARMGRPAPFLSGLCVALIPSVYIASTESSAVLWHAAAIWSALALVLARRPALAGLAAAVSAGCRMSTLLSLAPLLAAGFCVEPPETRRRAMLRVIGAAAIGTLICYMPELLLYLLGVLHVGSPALPFKAPDAGALFDAASGSIAAAAFGLGLLSMLIPKLRRPAPERGAASAITLFALLQIACCVLPALVAPPAANYFIPAIPALLLLCAAYLRSAVYAAVLALLLLAPWGSLAPVSVRSPVIAHYQLRREQLSHAQRWLSERASFHGAVVIAGDWEPLLNMLSGEKRPLGIETAWALAEPDLARYRAQRKQVVILRGGAAPTERVYRYDPSSFAGVETRD